MNTTTTSFTNKEHHLGLSLSLGLASTASTTASLTNHERTGGGVPVAARMRTQAAMPFQMMFSPAPHSGTGGGFSPFGSTHFVKYNHLPWTESPPVPFPDRNIETIRETTVEARAAASSSLRGIDVNRMPAADTEDDDAGVSSPNSTISSVSGKRTERDNNSNNLLNNENNAGGCDDDIAERTSSRGGGSDEDDGDTSRKKLRLSRDQSALLEETFKEHSTLNPKQKLALAKRLGLRPRQVEVWFQNRRARTKLKQTEVDCEFLKRCCEQLTEENRRLQKEVQDLRALKLSPQFYMQMTPPTTLTMCPSCERVGVPSSSNGPPPVQPVDPKAGNPSAGQRAGGPVHPAWIGGGPVAGLARPFEGVGLNGPR